MHELGVIHGRFQVLHNDHLKYLLAGKERCNHLVVGITNPEPGLTGDDEADPDRSRPEANPFTYYERYRMVNAALLGAGVDSVQFSIVPFPVNFPDRYNYYVPMDAVFYLTIYDRWGEKKLRMFSDKGLRTEILWRCTQEEKGLSSTMIRGLIRAGAQWENLVPEKVVPIIQEIISNRSFRFQSN
jgi:nicotinamide-nucleotide adenylyltransferase